MEVRKYEEKDLYQMIEIWNEVVKSANAFPQLEYLDEKTGMQFFKNQDYCAVAICEGEVAGLYILHPNNVGRCSHICNASFAVSSKHRGKHIGEELVKDCLINAKKIGFRIMQFNAVLEGNKVARHIYEKLGFVEIGVVPDGYKKDNGQYENIVLYYHIL